MGIVIGGGDADKGRREKPAKAPRQPKPPKEKKVREPKPPKEKKVREPKPPKEKPAKEPRQPRQPKERKPKEPRQPKPKKVRSNLHRHVNLFFRRDKTTKPATTLLYVIFMLAVVGLVGKFGVYDLLMEKRAAEQECEAVEAQVQEKMLAVKDFADTKLRYEMYARTDQEKEKTDRVAAIDVLDRAVGSMSEMRSLSIAGDTAQIRFDSIPLDTVSQIVGMLESEEIVKKVTLGTAATEAGTDSVGANVVVEFWAPKDLDAMREQAQASPPANSSEGGAADA